MADTYTVSDEDKKLVKDFYAQIFDESKPITEIYESVLTVYDRACEIIGFPKASKRLVTDLCEQFKVEDLCEKVVMDIGCGSGTTGQALAEKGCKQIHGLDPSEAMLKLCTERNIYSKLFPCKIF